MFQRYASHYWCEGYDTGVFEGGVTIKGVWLVLLKVAPTLEEGFGVKLLKGGGCSNDMVVLIKCYLKNTGRRMYNLNQCIVIKISQRI